MHTDQHLHLFLQYLKFEKRYSAHTVKAYEADLVQFFTYIGKIYQNIQAEELSPYIIRSWLAKLKENKADSKTINRKISTLKSFFKFEIRAGRLLQNPMGSLVSPKVSRSLPVFVPEESIEGLLTGLEFSEDWNGYNAKLIFNLFYATGIRLSELLILKPVHFDSGAQLLKVLGKGNKERLIPISAALLGKVSEYVEERNRVFGTYHEYLLVNDKGKPLYAKYVYLLVRKYLTQIRTLEKKSPHVLRHSFATHLSNNGAPINAVKDLLGHASLAATQVYTHNSIEKLRDQYRHAHPRERDGLKK